jgi:hypothetical protein
MHYGTLAHGRRAPGAHRSRARFAIKILGFCVFAGLVLTYCDVLITACMSGLH